MIFSGTLVSSGNGTALVTKIGMKTEMGKIQSSVADAEEDDSPLK